MMNLMESDVEKLIDLASRTKDLSQMRALSSNPSMLVRRALVRNVNCHESILEKLKYDPVENVGYMANKNLNLRNKRSFDSDLRACVTCEKPEKGLYCVECKNITLYSS